MIVSSIRHVGGAGGCPTVCAGIVPSASIGRWPATPNDHFTASPNGSVAFSRVRRVGGTGGCPTVGAGVVSPPSIEEIGAAILPAPDDHLAAGPDCCVKASPIGCVGGAGGCPTVGAGIVSPAGVQTAWAAVIPSPDDHFTASPHRHLPLSGIRRVGEARPSPCVVGAATRRTRYYRKRVVRAHCGHCDRHPRFGVGHPRSQRFFQPRNCGQLQPVFAFLHYCHGVVMSVVLS